MSHNYTIIVDSTTDLPQKRIDEWGISYIPYIYTLDKQEHMNYLDKRGMPATQMFDALRDGKTGTTTQVTQYRYIQTFEPFLREGQDILYMCLSSALSKSYEQSLLAVEELKERFPDRTVITIDTLSASLGQGLLAYYAVQARDEGKSLEEAAEYVRGLIGNLQHFVMADDLNHLRRGGRVSGASAFMGSLLGIKPIIIVNHKGELVPYHKCRGRGKALDYLADRVAQQAEQWPDSPIVISHGDAPEEVKKLRKLITERIGKREVIENNIGPVIGVHTGPGTIALMFMGDKRIEVEKTK